MPLLLPNWHDSLSSGNHHKGSFLSTLTSWGSMGKMALRERELILYLWSSFSSSLNWALTNSLGLIPTSAWLHLLQVDKRLCLVTTCRHLSLLRFQLVVPLIHRSDTFKKSHVLGLASSVVVRVETMLFSSLSIPEVNLLLILLSLQVWPQSRIDF